MTAITISLQFDPAKTSQAAVSDMIAKIYGLSPNDNPETGADADNDGGTTTNVTGADGGAILDGNGLPWDKRIHSDPATMTDKGVWRKKRGLQETTFAAVSAELRAAIAAKGTAAATPPTGTAPGLLPPAAATQTAAPAALAPLTLPPANVAPPTPSAYQQFVGFLADNINGPNNPNGRLTDDWIKQNLANTGIAGGDVASLASVPEDQVKAIHNAFRGALGLSPI